MNLETLQFIQWQECIKNKGLKILLNEQDTITPLFTRRRKKKMTTIFKMANQENITSTFEKVERDMIAPQNDEGMAIPSSLDEDSLSLEMDRLEKCASSGQNYSYISEWPVEQVSRLREYAEVVGFKGKMMPVTASNETPVTVEDDDVMKQLSSVKASDVNASSGLRLAVGDPFLLSDKNDVVKTKDNWEKVNQ